MIGSSFGDHYTFLADWLAGLLEEEIAAGVTAPTGLGPLIPNLNAAVQPIQAYVVENEISNSQALQEELELQATL